MLPEKFRQQHNAYLDAWMRAEEVLKETERIKNETFLPSIKELRYAARRIVQAHVDFQNGLATDEHISVHLVEAIENCHKARHDAIDSAVNFAHEQLDRLIDKADLAVVSQAFPRYAQLRKVIKQISERIIASRTNRNALDEQYEAIKREHLSELVELHLEMESSKDIIIAIQRKSRKDFLIGIVIVGTIVGMFAGAAVVVADKKGYFDWVTRPQTKEEVRK